MPGVIVQDDPENFIYPMPLTAHGKDEVFVGRIRRDESQPNTLNLWVVADNLRKGAATNAVSPTMPSGRVKVTNARCCGVSAPDDKDSKVRAQTSLRSRSSISLLESKFAVGE